MYTIHPLTEGTLLGYINTERGVYTITEGTLLGPGGIIHDLPFKVCYV